MDYDIRYSQEDKDFVENMPSKLLAELITLDDIIPFDIKNLLCINKTFEKERSRYEEWRCDNDPEFDEKDTDAFIAWKELQENKTPAEQMEIYIKQDCEFIIKYPQFKHILKGIEYCKHNPDKGRKLETVYEEPFDVYLERYIKEKESNN